jgi:hypothetical protein
MREDPVNEGLTTKYTKYTKGILEGDPLNLDFGVMAEVDQEAELEVGRAEIVEDLSLVLFGKIFGRLEFDDDLAITDEIRNVAMLQRRPFVAEKEIVLRLIGDAASLKFEFEALLIHGFQKAGTHLTIDFEDCALQGVAFIAIDQIRAVHFVYFVYFVVKPASAVH